MHRGGGACSIDPDDGPLKQILWTLYQSESFAPNDTRVMTKRLSEQGLRGVLRQLANATSSSSTLPSGQATSSALVPAEVIAAVQAALSNHAASARRESNTRLPSSVPRELVQRQRLHQIFSDDRFHARCWSAMAAGKAVSFTNWTAFCAAFLSEIQNAVDESWCHQMRAQAEEEAGTRQAQRANDHQVMQPPASAASSRAALVVERRRSKSPCVGGYEGACPSQNHYSSRSTSAITTSATLEPQVIELALSPLQHPGSTAQTQTANRPDTSTSSTTSRSPEIMSCVKNTHHSSDPSATLSSLPVVGGPVGAQQRSSGGTKLFASPTQRTPQMGGETARPTATCDLSSRAPLFESRPGMRVFMPTPSTSQPVHSSPPRRPLRREEVDTIGCYGRDVAASVVGSMMASKRACTAPTPAPCLTPSKNGWTARVPLGSETVAAGPAAALTSQSSERPTGTPRSSGGIAVMDFGCTPHHAYFEQDGEPETRKRHTQHYSRREHDAHSHRQPSRSCTQTAINDDSSYGCCCASFQGGHHDAAAVRILDGATAYDARYNSEVNARVRAYCASLFHNNNNGQSSDSAFPVVDDPHDHVVRPLQRLIVDDSFGLAAVDDDDDDDGRDVCTEDDDYDYDNDAHMQRRRQCYGAPTSSNVRTARRISSGAAATPPSFIISKADFVGVVTSAHGTVAAEHPKESLRHCKAANGTPVEPRPASPSSSGSSLFATAGTSHRHQISAVQCQRLVDATVCSEVFGHSSTRPAVNASPATALSFSQPLSSAPAAPLMEPGGGGAPPPQRCALPDSNEEVPPMASETPMSIPRRTVPLQELFPGGLHNDDGAVPRPPARCALAKHHEQNHTSSTRAMKEFSGSSRNIQQQQCLHDKTPPPRVAEDTKSLMLQHGATTLVNKMKPTPILLTNTQRGDAPAHVKLRKAPPPPGPLTAPRGRSADPYAAMDDGTVPSRGQSTSASSSRTSSPSIGLLRPPTTRPKSPGAHIVVRH